MCTLWPWAEADPNSSSSLSRQPRAEQARRRPWRQRAQDSGSQAVKPIRLNRVPLLRAESSSPSTATQGGPGLLQGLGLVSSSSSSLPCQKQTLKRGHPEGATEPQTPGSPAAKRRRTDDVPAQRAETSSSSTACQGVLRLSQDTQSPCRQAAPYRPPQQRSSSWRNHEIIGISTRLLELLAGHGAGSSTPSPQLNPSQDLSPLTLPPHFFRTDNSQPLTRSFRSSRLGV